MKDQGGHPNPAESILMIANSSADDKTEIRIMDLSGKQLPPFRLENNGGKSQVDVSYLKNGWYILMIRDQKSVVYKRFMVQHP